MSGELFFVPGAVVIFQLADVRYALPLPAVRECVPMPALFRPPGTPAPVLGYFRLGAERVVAIDLAVLLGLRPWRAVDQAGAETLYRPLLLGPEGEGARVAYMVDGVLDVRHVSGPVAAPCDSATAGDWLVGELDLGGGCTAQLMDPDRLLMARERQRIDHLLSALQERDALWEGTDA
ncbi:chemotaxis protein CheW [Gluconacetobacter johannae]|uniref:Chemotaxis protein CheW n=1 Tax=Gluconacetobacter johannae TaxID=112140 RepID=A0A7W4P4M4_9PROT|nr:chemotaxis protein CheW [Gluconacetobacter johannae]